MTTDPPTAAVRRMQQLCREQADDLRETLERTQETVAAPGTPASRDHARMLSWTRSTDRQDLWSRAAINALHMAVAVGDHLRALSVLLADPDDVPIYTHATVARAAVESAATIMHLTDATVPSAVRFARGVALLITDSDAARRAAAQVPNIGPMKAPGPAFAAQHQRLLDLLDRAKIQIVKGRDGKPKGVIVEPGGPEQPISVKASDLVRGAFTDLYAVYPMLSGVTHAMPWRLSDSADITGRQAHWSADPVDVGGSVIPALAAALRTAEAHARYRGQDQDLSLDRMRRRYRAGDDALKQLMLYRRGTPNGVPLSAFRLTGGA
ncbi:hypothetical protein [Phytohabitans houttuyneae]|uniref:Uncharacterized protein n=1 Tax=Phytohabitans houttuyneae TaxID=1076126 RepID=A0A6V8KSQ0_9ACTN|nr:hypothetical protein [Phytohabitans houttuyneae]GFJ84827.1 hypothetical protein Phou_090070 [Phytohabitans houttuyneae]